ncbi:MAG: beta-galactosidase, partial [Clostridia bacterium]|nr:beta-galactosidase [Clostridia bacterium]
GQEVGKHRGGYTSFYFDVTDALREGSNVICVYAEDDTRSPLQASGKQSDKYASYGCFYTRTTGIWQTVWMEAVEEGYVRSMRVYPNISVPSVTLALRTVNAAGQTAEIAVSYEGKPMGKTSVGITSDETLCSVNLAETHLWEIGNGRLYDFTVTLSGGDKVDSYFGLREVSYSKKGMAINGKVFFGRYILDQGFFPDGIYTAPTAERLKQDILDSMAMGFNGARMHEKVFEPLYLYWADKLGYLVWGEYPNWGLDCGKPLALHAVLPEWLEAMERDFSHPAIIGWCPFNETWNNGNGDQQIDSTLSGIYFATKAYDSTRPCIDTSGNFHVTFDIYDVHDYEQDPEKFRDHFAGAAKGCVFDTIARSYESYRQHYDPKDPLFVSEYGGIAWVMEEDKKAWGYGASVKTEEEFLARLKGLTDVLLDSPDVIGLCYTQLTDVEQEQNGLLTYDRRFKFPAETIYPIFSRKAKIEE